MGLTASTLAVAGFVGSATKAVGEFAESQAQAGASEFNADVARQEAELITIQEHQAIRKRRREALRLGGKQRAGFSKAGVLLEGSPLDVIEETFTDSEMDVMVTEFNARQARNAKFTEAEFADKRAKDLRRGGAIKAGTTLLTSGTNLFQKFSTPGKTKFGE